MNGVADETVLQTPVRSIKSTNESGVKSINILNDKLTRSVDEKNDQKSAVKLSPDSSTLCNGIDVSVDVDKDADNTNSTSKFTSLDSITEVVSTVTAPVSPNLANVVFLNPVTKTVTKGDTLKNPKLYVLNGNVLKEVNDVEKVKGDNVNYLCVTNNLGDLIKKIKCENVVKNGKPVLCNAGNGDAEPEKTKLLTTLPTFIQLSHATLKGSSQKIAFTVSPTIVTKPSGSNYEILRSKLMENSSAVTASTQSASKETVAGRLKNGGEKCNSILSSKKEQVPDSPAVAKARSELVRCRKALIEAAIHPQLPTYCPPAIYDGPMYTCEECEDTFASADSLNSHKNRRSVLFTYACPVCKKTLEFYNRCMFLLHVRSHDVAVKACFLTISIIPANKLNFAVLDDELHQSEVESASSLEPNNDCTEPALSIADEKSRELSPNSQVVHILKKRKASSLLEEIADDNAAVEDEEPFFADQSEMGDSSRAELVSSSDDAATANGGDSPSHVGTINANPSSNNTASVTIRATKLRKKRTLTSLMVKPGSAKVVNVDRSATYTTTNSTSTTPTSSYGNKAAESSVSITTSGSRVAAAQLRTLPKGVAAPALKLPYRAAVSVAPSSTTMDEIHLTSSDEEEVVLEDGEKNHPVACRECKNDVPNLTSHYRASNRPMKDFPCEQCKFFNPSACALAAHMRMHTRSIPFICPDCGFYFSTIDSFLIHVKQVCFYDFKTIRFKCPECSLLKPSVPQFLDHLKRCHIREVFKCSICITSSYSSRVVQTHMERVHPEAPKNVLEGYRCMLCPNVLVAKQSINVHVKKHVFGLQHLRYVYICKFCKKYASGRMSKFEEHYKSCPERDSCSPTPPERAARAPRKGSGASAGAAIRKSPEKRAPQSQDVTEMVAGMIVEKDPLSVEEWEADKLKAEYVPKTKWCVMCRTTKLNEHSKSLFCNACVSYVNADGSASGAASPVDGGAGAEDALKLLDGAVGRSKRKLKCKLCKQFLNRDWSTITNHYLQYHQADFDISVSKSKQQSDGSVAAPTSRKRKSSALKQQEQSVITPTTSAAAGNSSNSSASIVTSSSTSTAVVASTIPVGSGTVGNVTPTKLAKVECKYRCVKCGFSTNVRHDFHEHIVSHKTQSNTNYQCLECGECFIVKPSLQKHLIVVHKVRDINEYYAENKISGGGGSDDDADNESKEKKVLVENQCEVCYMECDTKQQYDRHIRTHGMAFVAMQSRAKS